jgi:hypothetical protein
MSLVPSTEGHVIQVQDTVVSREVMLRTWDSDRHGDTKILTDLRLTPDNARALAANLLHAARMLDGQQVSFKWHATDCSPVDRAHGTCVCSGKPVTV